MWREVGPTSSLGLPSDASQWAKLYRSNGSSIHLHVREEGRLNQRYALLFRDYLRADSGRRRVRSLKRALAEVALNDLDMYYAVKDPACDLIIATRSRRSNRSPEDLRVARDRNGFCSGRGHVANGVVVVVEGDRGGHDAVAIAGDPVAASPRHLGHQSVAAKLDDQA